MFSPESTALLEHTSRHSSLMASACALVPLTMATKSSAYGQTPPRGFHCQFFLTAGFRPRWILLFQYHRSFSGFPAQVALMQVLIELIQHDVPDNSGDSNTALCGTPSGFRKNRHRQCPALMVFHSRVMKRASLILRRTAFTSSSSDDVRCRSNWTGRLQSPSVPGSFTTQLQSQFHRVIVWWISSGRKYGARAYENHFPYRLHRHQHGLLNNTISRNAGIPSGRSLLLLRDVNPSGGQGLVVA